MEQEPYFLQPTMNNVSIKNNKASPAEETPENRVLGRSIPGAHYSVDQQSQQNTTAPWESLAYQGALGQVFELLTDPKDLVACASVCKSWSKEIADSDRLFKDVWTKKVSDQGLWRWSRAAGGYREQLRANTVVRKGDCIASVFPMNRREGKISEVLLLDAKPEPRICTMHNRPIPPHCIRVCGWTVKVWSAATLNAPKGPLCTIYDVVKHLQLEDGRLFLWRIREGAIIRVRSSGLAVGGAGAAAARQEDEECRRWTENPNFIASILDPITLELVDIPLDSTFGQGKCPFEFIDGGVRGVLVSAGVDPVENRIKIRLLDLKTGQCFRESSNILPDVGPDVLPLHPEAAAMLLSRNSDIGGQQILAGAALYDCRVFRWRLKDTWMAPKTRYNTDTSGSTNKQDQGNAFSNNLPVQPQGAGANAVAAAPAAAEPTQNNNNDNINTNIDIVDVGNGITMPSIPFGSHNSVKTDSFELSHIFTTIENEPICDLSMSTCAKRIYVVGLDNLYILYEDGTLQYTLPMSQWRGVREARSRFGHVDVGAFSWPLPNSRCAAFYLDITNSLYIANFEDAPHESFPWGYAPNTPSRANRQFAYRERIQSLIEGDLEDNFFPGHPAWVRRTMMPVESHTDLLPKPKAPPMSSTGRLNLSPDAEPVIVEYIQSGKTVFTAGNSSCPGTAALLKGEKDAGTYLYGLGPKSVAGRGKKAGPFVSRPGCGGGGEGSGGSGRGGKRKKATSSGSDDTLAPRAIICIDTETGRRYKTIPIEGMIESVHAAGHLLVAAVAPLNKGAEGCLVVVDFAKEGFGLTDAQRAEQRELLQNNNQIKGFFERKNEKNSRGEAGVAAVVAPASCQTGPSKAKRRRSSKK